MSRPSKRSKADFQPSHRRLRVFAFDPGCSVQLDTLSISELELELLWEELEPGPKGNYIEVVDDDPASGATYAPLDLNRAELAVESGLKPAEGIPQFHQQMVYAVAMSTIDCFERALGRVALWAPRVVRKEGRFKQEYVEKLRIYPHALREANAYYSPVKKALLFGYFPTRGGGPGQLPGGMVFTCLSYDIVAHETTHALLDGLHPRYNEATNLDMPALHEGFADIVALLQRFSHPEILEHQIALTRGSLERQSLLGQLGQQFGLALGMRSSLRSFLGTVDERGDWHPLKPDPKLLARTTEAHDRGGILVAAVFSAFLAIYKRRSADLFRIATGGSGVFATEGDIAPDLVRRLAREAAAAAEHLLKMCIRGLDYCPPVDVDFGTYLRAIITADVEVYPDDKYNYRIALIDAFRQWGVYPEGVISMSESVLFHSHFDDVIADAKPLMQGRFATPKTRSLQPPGQFTERSAFEPDSADMAGSVNLDWNLSASREETWIKSQQNAARVHAWLTEGPMKKHLSKLGLTLDRKAPPSVYRSYNGLPSIEINSVRTARRRGPRDELLTDLVVEVCQRRRGYLNPEDQHAVDKKGASTETLRRDFHFRRGCTLIIDPLEMRVRYAIHTKGDITDDEELDRVRRFISRQSVDNAFHCGPANVSADGEVFAALHRHQRIVADFE